MSYVLVTLLRKSRSFVVTLSLIGVMFSPSVSVFAVSSNDHEIILYSYLDELELLASFLLDVGVSEQQVLSVLEDQRLSEEQRLWLLESLLRKDTEVYGFMREDRDGLLAKGKKSNTDAPRAEVPKEKPPSETKMPDIKVNINLECSGGVKIYCGELGAGADVGGKIGPVEGGVNIGGGGFSCSVECKDDKSKSSSSSSSQKKNKKKSKKKKKK